MAFCVDRPPAVPRVGGAVRDCAGRVVSVGVDVDVVPRPFLSACGGGRAICNGSAGVVGRFVRGSPWRTFRWYFGQRHYSGTWWSSTMRDHVIYESRLELSRLLLADFDPCVRKMIAQPFMVTATVGGCPRRHILDYLWETVKGPVVVDVVRTERLDQSGCCAAMQVDSRNRRVTRLGLPRTVRTPARRGWTTLRFLAGYRRDWLIHPEILEEMRSRTRDLTGMSIADAEREFVVYPKPLVRPALMHLLWRHKLAVDLDKPLRPSTVLEASR